MKMSTGSLFRRAARMEHVRALYRQKRRHFQFFESGGRHGGNLRPMRDGQRGHVTRLANPPIRRIVIELKCKQFQRECAKNRFFRGGTEDKLAQSRGEL